MLDSYDILYALKKTGYNDTVFKLQNCIFLHLQQRFPGGSDA